MGPGTDQAWVLQGVRPGHAEQRLRGEDRGEEGDDHAEAEGEREPADAGGREDEQDERGEQRDDVRVDDRGEALAVADPDGRGDRSAPEHLLFHAFEDHDVRVGAHSDRQHEPGQTGQREGDGDQLDQGEEVDAVDRQRADGEQAEHAVEDEQEDRDDDEADARGEQALVERLLAERRRDL